MMFKTHLALGAFFGILLLKYLKPEHAIIFSALLMIGSVIPDIDTTKGIVGKRLWPFSAAIALFVRHRGFLHTVWVPLISYGISWYFGQDALGMAFAFGYLLHIMADAMTEEGVSLFQPLWRHHFHGFVKTGGTSEYVFLLLLCVSLGLIASALFAF